MSVEKVHAVQFFPAMSDRAPWEELKRDPAIRKYAADLAAEAEKLLAQPIVEMPATAFLDYFRTGDRRKGETLYFARRQRLVTLLLAEALEYKGRFVDGIVNAVWAILNEPTWCLPAHTRLTAGDALPDFASEEVDLFSAQTSAVLASTLMLAEKELAAVSPTLVKRMRRTVIRRAICPVEEDLSRFWWHEGRNNWTPWICANLLNSANTVLADDPSRLLAYTRLLQSCMDRYYTRYLEDGACEEGPGYWAKSPGIAILYYELLCRMSDGASSIFNEEKFIRMIRYAGEMQIGNNCFFPFSDSPPVVSMPCGLLAMYARRTGDPAVRDFARRCRKVTPLSSAARDYIEPDLLLADIFFHDDGPVGTPEDFVSYYPALQLLSLRAGRLRLAAIAGNNGFCHNHNDVGQFILVVDGKFQVMDLGAPEYTRFTFSEQRYDDPIINSLYHNVPIFDGVGQMKGAKHAARDVTCRQEGKRVIFAMELAGTYPETLGLRSCRRTVTLDAETSTLEVRDEWSAEKPRVYSVTLFAQTEAAKSPVALTASLPVTEEKFAVTDPKQRRSWGDTLWTRRIVSGPAASGVNIMRFTLKP